MRMKLAETIMSGIILMSGAAFGLDLDPSFYVGGELGINRLKNGDNSFKGNNQTFRDANGQYLLRKKSAPSVGLNVGSRITENLGLEVGYSFLRQSKNTYANNSSFNVKMRNSYVDALGYIPVAENADIIASVGLGRLSTKVQMKSNNVAQVLSSTQSNDAKTKTGIRLGLGAQYKFDSNLGARFMIRHQKGNKLIKSVNSAGVGLFYQF